MIALTVILGVACSVIIILLFLQNGKLAKISAEYSVTKDVVESMKQLIADRGSAPAGRTEAVEGQLTVEGIEQAVRHAGYVPDKSENYIRFMVAGNPHFIEISRLPTVFVFTQHSVEVKEWDMDLFKKAAHLMSDDLIIVKAIFYEDEEDTSIRVLVASLDANNASFQTNLTRYIGLIEDAHQKMNEIYDGLLKEKKDASLTENPFLTSRHKDGKVMS